MMSKGIVSKVFSGEASRKQYYLVLCMAVLIGWFGVNLGILILGRTPMWRDDALPLYVNFIAWEGQALRDAFLSLFAGNGFAFPLYTSSLGYGADTIVTMIGCINDPFNLISILFPPGLAEVPYVLMIPVRLMLAASFFSWYCFERGHGSGETLVASLCYTFGGYTVFWGILRHANFINWAITLPLVLLGADRIFAGKKPTVFIWGIALQFLVSVYFTFMSCVALLVYCLVKYFFAPRERSAFDFAKLVGKFVAFLAIGFCIGAVFALPSIIALLSQGRATGGADVPTFFSLSYYAAIGVQSVGGLVTTRGMYTGAVSIVLGLVFILCGRHFPKEVRRPWLAGLVLCWIGVLVPFVGHVFNGFGYVSDRWMLVYNFVCSYIVCLTIPVLTKLSKKELKRVAICVGAIGLWAALYVAYPILITSNPIKAIWPFGMIVILCVAFMLVRRHGKKLVTLLALVVIIGVSANAASDLSPLGSSYINYFPKFGVSGQDLTSASPAAAIDQIEDDTLFRQTYGRVYGGRKNAALTHGTMGVDFYSSYYNQYVDDYRQELGLSDHFRNYSFVGNESRLALEAIAGVKYYVSNNADAWRAPYGYTELDSEITGSTTYRVYKAEKTLPIGFLSNTIVLRSVYDGLPMPEKQDALLEGIVVDESQLVGSYSVATCTPNIAPIEYAIEGTDKLSIDGNIIEATEDGASLTLSFKGLPNSETYIFLDDLAYSGHSPIQRAEANGDSVSLKTRIRELLWTKPTTYTLDFSIGDKHRSLNSVTPAHSGYGGKDNWIVNMGYSADARTVVEIQFSRAGTYAFNELGVYCEPVEPLVSRIDSMGSSALQDVELGVNRISAIADLPDDSSRLAFVSMAYTPGWSATVDGSEVPILRADTAFMAIELSGSGSHEIEFTYMTPGLKEGALVTVLGLSAFIVVTMFGRKREAR